MRLAHGFALPRFFGAPRTAKNDAHEVRRPPECSQTSEPPGIWPNSRNFGSPHPTLQILAFHHQRLYRLFTGSGSIYRSSTVAAALKAMSRQICWYFNAGLHYILGHTHMEFSQAFNFRKT
jgi:hypothetical protein